MVYTKPLFLIIQFSILLWLSFILLNKYNSFNAVLIRIQPHVFDSEKEGEPGLLHHGWFFPGAPFSVITPIVGTSITEVDLGHMKCAWNLQCVSSCSKSQEPLYISLLSLPLTKRRLCPGKPSSFRRSARMRNMAWTWIQSLLHSSSDKPSWHQLNFRKLTDPQVSNKCLLKAAEFWCNWFCDSNS